jgi:type IV fimbrial biogenesis protein FimT
MVELVVTIMVLAILLGVAVPNFGNMIQSNRVTAESNNLSSALSLARSEAVKRAEIVSVCASDGAEPLPGCGDDWANGWLVFVNPEAVGEPDAGNIVRVWDAVPDRLSLETTTQGASGQAQLDFDDLGALANASLANFRYQWHLQPDGCSNGHPFRRTVDVSSVGRVQVTRENC